MKSHQENLQQILNELYNLDPKLRSLGPKLEILVSSLMGTKPEVKIDQRFVKRLRQVLLAESASHAKVRPTTFNLINNFSNYMNKLNYVLGGVLLVIVVIAGSFYLLNQPVTNDSLPLSNSSAQLLSGEIKIVDAGAYAFGNLSQLNVQAGERGSATPLAMGGDSAKMGSAIGLGGGGVVSAAPAQDMSVVPPNESINYKFVYRGEAIDLSNLNSLVYKRVKGFGGDVNLSSLLGGLNFGLANINSFDNLKLQTLSLMEDRDFGYQLYIDLMEGTVSVNENWYRWNVPGRNCQDQVCIDNNRLDLEDLPADQEVINISNQFLSEHNIPRDNYGEPFVDNRWRRDYAAADKRYAYVTDTLSVIYPLMIDGQTVYDEGGSPTGLYVSVNVRVNKVSSVYNLTSQNYQSSSYQLEKDVNRLLAVAEQGGWRNYLYNDPNATQTVEIELGTPKISYVKVWQYNGQFSNELLVPSLIFPVNNTPATGPMYWRTSVMVPLVQELLNEQQSPVMPLLEKPLPVDLPAKAE